MSTVRKIASIASLTSLMIIDLSVSLYKLSFYENTLQSIQIELPMLNIQILSVVLLFIGVLVTQSFMVWTFYTCHRIGDLEIPLLKCCELSFFTSVLTHIFSLPYIMSPLYITSGILFNTIFVHTFHLIYLTNISFKFASILFVYCLLYGTLQFFIL